MKEHLKAITILLAAFAAVVLIANPTHGDPRNRHATHQSIREITRGSTPTRFVANCPKGVHHMKDVTPLPVLAKEDADELNRRCPGLADFALKHGLVRSAELAEMQEIFGPDKQDPGLLFLHRHPKTRDVLQTTARPWKPHIPLGISSKPQKYLTAAGSNVHAFWGPEASRIARGESPRAACCTTPRARSKGSSWSSTSFQPWH